MSEKQPVTIDPATKVVVFEHPGQLAGRTAMVLPEDAARYVEEHPNAVRTTGTFQKGLDPKEEWYDGKTGRRVSPPDVYSLVTEKIEPTD